MTARIWPTIAAAMSGSGRSARSPLVWNPVEHLLSRASFGPTPATRAYVAAHGPDAWYQQQVAYGTTYRGYAAHPKVVAQGPLLRLTPYDLRTWLKAQGNEYGWTAMDQLTRVTLGLQGWSKAQLYEVLVDFFANHLNVPNHNGDLWNTRHTFDRDVVRRYAMGSFTSMLLASAKNPAMLNYLNLAQSTKTAINENYGRELLELHTVGLNYSESDVKNAARILTGRSLDNNQHYVYDDYVHATGSIRVLGFRHANTSAVGGERAGDDLLRYLAAHPFTASNLARKLCVRLVSDSPSTDLVKAVAQAYLANGTQILPMVSTILRSSEFWQSRGLKVRRPTENVMATIRTLDLAVTDWAGALSTLHWTTQNMGHTPLDWPAPNGYPDVAAAWRSAGSLLATWNMHLGLTGGWWTGLPAPSVDALYGTAPATSGQAIDQLCRRLTGQPWTPAHRAALQSFLNEPASTPMARSTVRWQAVPLIGLILDGPHHALR